MKWQRAMQSSHLLKERIATSYGEGGGGRICRAEEKMRGHV